jgi:ABC-type multidrug transport system fused ATPase/permease subunit
MWKFELLGGSANSVNNSRLALAQAFKLLESSDIALLKRWTLAQFIVNFLDLAGIFITACIVDLSLHKDDKYAYTTSTKFLLNFFGLDNTTHSRQISLLVGILLLFLISKTLCSVFITRKIIFFLTKKASSVSLKLIKEIFSSWKMSKVVKSTDEMIYSITRGIDFLLVEVVANIIVLICDITLLFIMVLGLIYIDPKLAIITIILFTVVGLVLNRSLSHRSLKLGKESAKLNVSINELVAEVFHSFREYFVRNRIWFNIEQISFRRGRYSSVMAELTFMPFISKYVFELTLVFGAVVLGIYQVTNSDAEKAILSATVFLVAGTRITPALLRIQQNILQIKSRIGMAAPSLDLIHALKNSDGENRGVLNEIPQVQQDQSGHLFAATLVLKDLSFKYSDKEDFAIKNLNLNLESNKVLGLFGKSGSGKTTVVDLILGLLIPDQGSVLISGVAPEVAIKKWSGKIGYVPQDISLFNGTIKDNLLRGFDEIDFTHEEIEISLARAGLLEFVSAAPEGLNTEIGERGNKLSGGQRQRLGVARVLLTDPKFIILDEATSALDVHTENEIIENLKSNLSESILIIITHRKNLLKNCDLVVELETGNPTFIGSYENFIVKNELRLI